MINISYICIFNANSNTMEFLKEKNKYSKVSDFQNGIYRAEIEKKLGYVDVEGNIIIPIIYDEIKEFVNGKAIIRLNQKYGYIDRQGNVLIPCIYDEILEFKNQKTFSKLNGVWGYIDEFNTVLLPFEFRTLRYAFEGSFIAEKGICNDDKKEKIMFKYGVIDIFNNILLPFVYYDIKALNNQLITKHSDDIFEEIYNSFDENYNETPYLKDAKYVDNHIIIRKSDYNDYFGVIDFSGAIILPFEYNSIEVEFLNNTHGRSVSRFQSLRVNQKKGILKLELKKDSSKIYGCIEQNKILIPFDYDYLEIFESDNILAVKKDKYGCFDMNGELILPFIYNSKSDLTIIIRDFNKKQDVNQNDTKEKENKLETSLPFIYNHVEYIGEDRFKTEMFEVYSKEHNKRCCFDSNGKMRLPFFFDSITDINNEKAIVRINYKYGIVNLKGEILIEAKHNCICFIKNDLYIAQNDGFEDYIFFDENAKVMYEKGVKTNYPTKTIEKETQHGYTISWKEGGFGCLNSKEDTILPFKYQDIVFFTHDKVIVAENMNYGCIDLNDNVSVPLVYDYIKGFNENKSVAIKNGKYGYISDNGIVLVPFEYENIPNFESGKAIATKKIYDSDGISEELVGYITEKNEILVPFKYDYIQDFFKGKAIACTDYLCGLINDIGEIVIPFKFDEIERLESGFLLVVNDKGQVGCYDDNGIILLNPIYDSIFEIKGGKVLYEKNDKYGFIDIETKKAPDFLKNRSRRGNLSEIDEKSPLAICDYLDPDRESEGECIYIDEEGNIKQCYIRDGREFDDVAEYNNWYDKNWKREHSQNSDYERDNYDAITDGQYEDYDEWKNDEGDYDKLKDSLGF
jgi:WG containing repeat